MSLSHSEAFLGSAYPKEYTETFQAAQVAAFSFFGAVPTRTASDNTTIVGRKVIGRERELIREFLRHESYYLFAHRFCRVAGATRRATSRAWSATGGATSWCPSLPLAARPISGLSTTGPDAPFLGLLL